MIDFAKIKESIPYDNYGKFSIVKITDDLSIDVLQYLPIKEKVDLINTVIENALDEDTGCFSPVRVDLYYTLAMLNKYCDISFEGENLIEAYDYLQQEELIDRLFAAIPEDERIFIQQLVDDTIEDITKYNHSAAGIIHSMAGDATNLDESVQNILSKMKNKEEIASVLKQVQDVVETD